MTKLAFQLKPGDIFLATPINEFVTLQENFDKELGKGIVLQTDKGFFQANPYEQVQIK